MVGISADAPERNLAWAKELKLWDDLWRIQKRTTVIVDRQGKVRWTESGGVCIDTSRTLDALTRLARER